MPAVKAKISDLVMGIRGEMRTGDILTAPNYINLDKSYLDYFLKNKPASWLSL